MNIVKIAEITADLKYEKAEDALNKLINHPPASSRVIEFTPELAQHILVNLNHKNRPRKSSKIVQYATDMAEDKWLLTGETVKFGSDGLLKDGQNRMAACVRANKPFKTHALFGIDPKAFAVMDTGANRSHSDVLSIMGVKNATTVTAGLKTFMCWQNGKTNTGAFKITNEDLRSYYMDEVDHEAMQRAVLMAKQVHKTTDYKPAYITALYYTCFLNGDEDLCIEFLDAMRNGIGGARSPQKVLMKHLTTIKANPSYKLTSHDCAVLITRAWYAYKNKVSMSKSDLTVLLTDSIAQV